MQTRQSKRKALTDKPGGSKRIKKDIKQEVEDEDGSECVEESHCGWWEASKGMSCKSEEKAAAESEVEDDMDIKMEDIDDSLSEDKTTRDPCEKYVIELKQTNRERCRFKCSICGKLCLSRDNAIKHVRIHTDHKPYKCKTCGSAFAQIGTLRVHETIHSGKKPFRCSECYKRFALKARLKRHMRLHTREDKTTRDPCEKYVIDLKKTNEVQGHRFKCSICSKLCLTKENTIKHIHVHTGHRPFKCKTCGAAFAQITALNGHETIHSGEKPFRCSECYKRFALKPRLKLHMRIHTGEKPYKCEHCGRAFARRSHINQHMTIHTGDKKYMCPVHGCRFATKTKLNLHMRTHEGKKEVKCSACNKKFAYVQGLYTHIRTVHDDYRPYTCNLCGKAFKGHLDQHMKLHLDIRPYKCLTCNGKFAQNSQLTVHMRTHTGERPYKCQICSAAFAHTSILKIHMRSHTGEKPFQCVLCTATFSQLAHMKKHMKCVHNITKPYICTTCKEYFQTKDELQTHSVDKHGIVRTDDNVNEGILTSLRYRLAVLIYRISSEKQRLKFGFGTHLVDDVLKKLLKSSDHSPVNDQSLSRLDELRKNVMMLLRWTTPKDTMDKYDQEKTTVDDVLETLTRD